MPWRPKSLPDLADFLHNHLPDIAAIDMFCVATASFASLRPDVLSLDRQRVVTSRYPHPRGTGFPAR